MKIRLKVIPNASRDEVLELASGQYRVKVKSPALDGKANVALIEVLAAHFKVKKSAVHILQGENSRNKMIEIVI